jgi:hypothetical protein
MSTFLTLSSFQKSVFCSERAMFRLRCNYLLLCRKERTVRACALFPRILPCNMKHRAESRDWRTAVLYAVSFSPVLVYMLSGAFYSVMILAVITRTRLYVIIACVNCLLWSLVLWSLHKLVADSIWLTGMWPIVFPALATVIRFSVEQFVE